MVPLGGGNEVAEGGPHPLECVGGLAAYVEGEVDPARDLAEGVLGGVGADLADRDRQVFAPFRRVRPKSVERRDQRRDGGYGVLPRGAGRRARMGVGAEASRPAVAEAPRMPVTIPTGRPPSTRQGPCSM